MVIVKEVSGKVILDSRKEKTISVSIGTDVGTFHASSPTGKSTGKYEAKPYKKNVEGDAETLKKFSDYFSEEHIDKFEDLMRIEDIIANQIGANTLFAFESAVLKAIAYEQKKEVWEIVNPELNTKKAKFPKLVGNCVEGGKHSNTSKKPDFQEFELISNMGSVKKNYERNKSIKEEIRDALRKSDKNFEGKRTDENAWMTSLNERDVLEIMIKFRIPLGVDIAASSFFKRKKYYYDNPVMKRDSEEQFNYISNLVKNFNLYYIEDPFEENDFESFAKLLKKFPNSLIVGDDLTTTNSKRLKKAIEKKSINGIIIKPNQCGSLLEVKRVVEMAKENNIKMIFSHRSGETEETILADLAFGFQADFFKCGTEGDVRIKKILRLIEIEGSI
jgi:enolase